jgi:hypothetical protein
MYNYILLPVDDDIVRKIRNNNNSNNRLEGLQHSTEFDCKRDPSSQKEYMTDILRLRGGFSFDSEGDDTTSFDIKLAWSSAEQDSHRPRRLTGHQQETRSEAKDLIIRTLHQTRPYSEPAKHRHHTLWGWLSIGKCTHKTGACIFYSG